MSFNPVVSLTLLACYATNIQSPAADLGLTRTDRRTSNVLITSPADPLLLRQPRQTDDGLPTTPVSQVLADLLSLPGRSAQEAEQLMDALAVYHHTGATTLNVPVMNTDADLVDLDALVLGPVRLTFQRTLRVPERGLHDLPPGLGGFPIRRVEDYPDTVPGRMA